MPKEKDKKIYIHGQEKFSRSIKHNGLYDLKKIISVSNAYLKRLKYDVLDKQHEEKTKANGMEISVVMAAKREISIYIQYMIEIKIHIMNQIDVLLDKKKLQKGRMEVLIKVYMEKNYKKTFKDTKFSESLRRIYDKFIVKKELDAYEDDLKIESNDLVDLIKEQLV